MLTQNQGRLAILERIRTAYQNNPTRTIAIGVGVLVLTPAVIPLLKPVAKAAIKGGVSMYEKTKAAIAETGEVFGDIVAEAKAEVVAESQQKSQQKTTYLANTSTPKN
ncbi:MAG: DUF5132 domain-containing protein [Limnoraphis robusta]|uniref:DUF5132 domain-containing protein n=1 Tax=Limnoraphis robusta CS-951 TaxID=1637645 RepID=A0A0F5YEX5_9CYAN|nr:DUF5132 domain-containing protein [Limnoraphis robusta]KKD36775.1 hypothetical protein WN50_17915 [Limnoraphis robusta CS-951]